MSGRNYLYSTHRSDISKISQAKTTKQDHNTTIQGMNSSKVNINILTKLLVFFSSRCCARTAPSSQLQQLLPNKLPTLPQYQRQQSSFSFRLKPAVADKDEEVTTETQQKHTIDKEHAHNKTSQDSYRPHELPSRTPSKPSSHRAPPKRVLRRSMSESGRLLLKEAPPSERAAATRIQAYWRGRQLQRTRPLEKLQAVYQVL